MSPKTEDLTKDSRNCDWCGEFARWKPDMTQAQHDKAWNEYLSKNDIGKPDAIRAFGDHLCKNCKAQEKQVELEDQLAEQWYRENCATKACQAAGTPLPIKEVAPHVDTPYSSSAHGASSTNLGTHASGTRQSSSQDYSPLGSNIHNPHISDDSQEMDASPGPYTPGKPPSITTRNPRFRHTPLRLPFRSNP